MIQTAFFLLRLESSTKPNYSAVKNKWLIVAARPIKRLNFDSLFTALLDDWKHSFVLETLTFDQKAFDQTNCFDFYRSEKEFQLFQIFSRVFRVFLDFKQNCTAKKHQEKQIFFDRFSCPIWEKIFSFVDKSNTVRPFSAAPCLKIGRRSSIVDYISGEDEEILVKSSRREK